MALTVAERGAKIKNFRYTKADKSVGIGDCPIDPSHRIAVSTTKTICLKVPRCPENLISEFFTNGDRAAATSNRTPNDIYSWQYRLSFVAKNTLTDPEFRSFLESEDRERLHAGLITTFREAMLEAENAAPPELTPIEITEHLDRVAETCLDQYLPDRLPAIREQIVSAAPPAGFQFTRLDKLLVEPPEAHGWVWDETLIEGGLSLIAAKPKVGKSTAVRNLARAISRGEPFLGRPTKRGCVVYLELEEKRTQVAKHFRAMGVNGDEEIFIHTGPAPGGDPLNDLRAAIETHKAILAVVDPLFKLIRLKDGNDYVEVTRALEPLMNIARQTGCHILLIHHFGKGDREGGDQILGSTALFAAVDTALFMRKREQYRTLTSIQRYGTDLEDLALAFDKETGLITTSGSVEELETLRAIEAISKFMRTREEWVSQAEIREEVEDVRISVLVRALHQGFDVRVFARAGAGKRGDPYVYQTILFAGSHVYTGTRKTESQNQQQTIAGVDDKVVPENRVPGTGRESVRKPESGPDVERI
jgi:AAA domain